MKEPVKRALERVETLGKVSDHPDYLERTFLSQANRAAGCLVGAWMEALGMEVTHAADGTVRGILAGQNPDEKPLLLGSHLDTVIDAGKYDGALGIIVALAALESLQEPPQVPLHLLAFSDEEGVRFQTTYLGSRALTGPLDEVTLACCDASHKELKAVIAEEGWHEGAERIGYEKGKVRGYLEVHIEQGRVLEEADEPLGVVSGIVGQYRLRVSLTGRCDHAGTTPMALRQDALTGAAECILAAENLAQENSPLVMTVGKIAVHPGASNSIPQTATFSIDMRHPDDGALADYSSVLEKSCGAIAEKRGLAFHWTLVQEEKAVVCDEGLVKGLCCSVREVVGTERVLLSGAGHDGVALSQIGPIGMLFVRCRDGLSHHPEEYASPEDIELAIEALSHFLNSYQSVD